MKNNIVKLKLKSILSFTLCMILLIAPLSSCDKNTGSSPDLDTNESAFHTTNVIRVSGNIHEYGPYVYTTNTELYRYVTFFVASSLPSQNAAKISSSTEPFFISKSLQKSLKNAEIYEGVMGSDHCPISIELEF